MPPVPIPYARREAYDNSDYVRTMAQLMLQNAERQQQLRLARGQNSQQMWQGLGQTAAVTMGSMMQSRDEQQKLAMLQAERDREYALKQREMEERAKDRKADLEYRQRTEKRQADLDRDKRAEEETSLTQVGDVVPMSEFRQSSIPGSPSVRAFRPQGYEAARLPATPFIESGGIPSYTTPIPEAGGVPQAGGGAEEYLTGPTRRTMSTDVAERPEGMRRVASQAELVQLETLRRQAEAAQIAAQNTLADNAARDEAARRKAIYDAESLRLRGLQVAATQANAGGTPQIIEAGGQFFRVGKGPGGVVETVMAPGGDKPLTKYADTSAMGPMRNMFDRAISNVQPNRRGPLVAQAERLMNEGNTQELLGVIKKTVIESTPVDMQTQVVGRIGTIAALKEAKTILSELQAKGVPTGWLTGTAEDLYRRLGSSSNPEYVRLAGRLDTTLANYRRSMTGAAFSASEGEDYKRLFPTYRNSPPVNLAQIDGLLDAMGSYDRSFWEMKLGPEGAAMLGYGGAPAAPTAPTKPAITRDANGNLLPPPRK